jgi:hypothetical protein
LHLFLFQSIPNVQTGIYGNMNIQVYAKNEITVINYYFGVLSKYKLLVFLHVPSISLMTVNNKTLYLRMWDLRRRQFIIEATNFPYI